MAGSGSKSPSRAGAGTRSPSRTGPAASPLVLPPGAKPGAPQFVSLEQTALAWPRKEASAEIARQGRAAEDFAASSLKQAKEKSRRQRSSRSDNLSLNDRRGARRKGKGSNSQDSRKWDAHGRRIKPSSRTKTKNDTDKKSGWQVNWEKLNFSKEMTAKREEAPKPIIPDLVTTRQPAPQQPAGSLVANDVGTPQPSTPSALPKSENIAQPSTPGLPPRPPMPSRPRPAPLSDSPSPPRRRPSYSPLLSLVRPVPGEQSPPRPRRVASTTRLEPLQGSGAGVSARGSRPGSRLSSSSPASRSPSAGSSRSPRRAGSVGQLSRPASISQLSRPGSIGRLSRPGSMGRLSRPGSIGGSAMSSPRKIRLGSMGRPASLTSLEQPLSPPVPMVKKSPSDFSKHVHRDSIAELRALQQKLMPDAESQLDFLQEQGTVLFNLKHNDLQVPAVNLDDCQSGPQSPALSRSASHRSPKMNESSSAPGSRAVPSPKGKLVPRIVTAMGDALTSARAGSSASARRSPSTAHRLESGNDNLARSASKRKGRSASKQSNSSDDENDGGLDKDLRARLTEVFHRIQDGGEVHRDQFKQALGLAGFVMNSEAIGLIDEAYDKLFSYNTTNRAEFLLFAAEFRALQNERSLQAFKAFDSDGSGTIDVDELALLLESRGMYPLQHVMHELVLEACHGDVEGGLDHKEFQKVVDLLIEREGFTKAQIHFYEDLFDKCDYSGDGKLDNREIGRLMCSLGYSQETPFLDELAKVDVEGSGEINKRDFLVFMRRIRERDIAFVKKFFAENDTDGEPGLDSKELHEMLRNLDYLPDMTCILETLEQLGHTDPEEDLDFSEVWKFLELYRRQQGLTLAEVKEAEDTFKKFSSGFTVGIDSLPDLLRTMGYLINYHEIRRMIYQIDADESGVLNQTELLQILALQRDRELRNMWKALCEDESVSDEEVKYVQKMLGDDMVALARNWPSTPPQAESSEAKLSFVDFVPRANQVRRVRRRKIQKNHGFSDKEAEELTRCLEKYAHDDRGRVRSSDLRKLLCERFPLIVDKKTLKGTRDKLHVILSGESSGFAGPDEFLQLARACQNLVESDMWQQDSEAITKTGFDKNEVNEFRTLFLGDSQPGADHTHVSLAHVKELLGKVVPLGHKRSLALERQLTSMKGVSGQGEDSVDFPQFLLLMRRLLDDNFAGIAELGAGHGAAPDLS